MEYASFHYLMHKVPEPTKAVYVTGPSPLKFEELYSPRSERIQIAKSEKSYWRTRDRVEYVLWEDRRLRLLIITCRSIETSEAFRTIFLDLERLYFEVESKARGSRELLKKVKEKKLVDDPALHKGVADYVLARLNIQKDPLPWPTFRQNTSIVETVGAPSVSGSSFLVEEKSEETLPTCDTTLAVSLDVSASPAVDTTPRERMCTFDKLSGDEYDFLEVDEPEGIDLEGLAHVRRRPPIPLSDKVVSVDIAVLSGEDTTAATSSPDGSQAVTSTAIPGAVAGMGPSPQAVKKAGGATIAAIPPTSNTGAVGGAAVVTKQPKPGNTATVTPASAVGGAAAKTKKTGGGAASSRKVAPIG